MQYSILFALCKNCIKAMLICVISLIHPFKRMSEIIIISPSGFQALFTTINTVSPKCDYCGCIYSVSNTLVCVLLWFYASSDVT